MDVGLRAEQRNLDRPHPQPQEVLEPVGGEQDAVGKDVDPAATVAGVENEVMDIRQESGRKRNVTLSRYGAPSFQ